MVRYIFLPWRTRLHVAAIFCNGTHGTATFAKVKFRHGCMFILNIVGHLTYLSNSNVYSYLRNRKRLACVYGVIMHAGNVGRIREKRVKHEA
jgi:uncharacterized membrane protein